MSITTTDHDDAPDDGRVVEAVAGHHETREQRDFKERFALWLFIAGDALFLLMEMFFWFYLRALNTNGLWRGADCSKANPCTDGLGNPMVQEVQKANPAYSVVIAAVVVLAALLIVITERAALKAEKRGVVTATAGLAVVALLGAIAVQCYQFGTTPFTTIQGTYGSSYLFFMGSTLGHIILLAVIVIGLWNRARSGKYDNGQWHQIRVIRMFAVWIALSAVILAAVSSLFA
jgi:heme/copper-type cytochrome/quinol oxidase subunit 3